MNKNYQLLAIVSVMFLGLAPLVKAQEAKPIPSSRQEMLAALDALKHRQARLPLPAGDADSAAGDSGNVPSGRLGVVNNGRMRALYLPEELSARRGSGSGSANQSQFSYEFSTQLFWIVSRVNNCQYCLGHQENKLKTAGLSELELLALDTDWTTFSPQQRVAFAFASKLTHAPHTINDQDIASLRMHYSDDEILEIIFLIGRYNSTNRWTDSLGIPQEEHRDFVSELSEAELRKQSQVAVKGFQKRPTLESYMAWREELEVQSQRRARLTPSATISLDDAQPHERLIALIPAAGASWPQQLDAARLTGDLPPVLRDMIAFVAAREDHAWYMQNLSRTRLMEAGLTDQTIFSLGMIDKTNPTVAKLDPAEELALQFAIKLTSAPQSIVDTDIDRLNQHYTPHQIAEIVYHTALAALLNRLTETVRLELTPLSADNGQ